MDVLSRRRPPLYMRKPTVCVVSETVMFALLNLFVGGSLTTKITPVTVPSLGGILDDFVDAWRWNNDAVHRLRDIYLETDLLAFSQVVQQEFQDITPEKAGFIWKYIDSGVTSTGVQRRRRFGSAI